MAGDRQLGYTARLWDLAATDPSTTAQVLRGHQEPITAVAISRDTQWVVTGSWDTTARLWELRLEDLVDHAGRIAEGRILIEQEWDEYFPDGWADRQTSSSQGIP